MVTEKMTELKIVIPERWLNFINDYYQVCGRDRDEDLVMMIKAQIEMPMLEDELLPVKDRVRLHDKYLLSDICEISPRTRDEAAGISRPGKPEKTPDDLRFERAVHCVVNKPEWKGIYTQHLKDAFLRGMELLSPEEINELQAMEMAATAGAEN